jgi:hypothetical protein
MGGFDDYKPAMAMAGLQFIYAGLALFTRVALLQGMSPMIFVVYRHDSYSLLHKKVVTKYSLSLSLSLSLSHTCFCWQEEFWEDLVGIKELFFDICDLSYWVEFSGNLCS